MSVMSVYKKSGKLYENYIRNNTAQLMATIILVFTLFISKYLILIKIISFGKKPITYYIFEMLPVFERYYFSIFSTNI